MVQAMRKLPAAAYVKPTHKRLKAFRNPFEPVLLPIGLLLAFYFLSILPH